MELVLASASPRRSELLLNAGIPFLADPAHVEELREGGENPTAYAQRLARDKARVVLARHPQSLVLGADTIVVVDEEVLEKPANDEDARKMIRRISGRAHQVITGICLCSPRQEWVESETTRVIVAELSNDEISQYIATREPVDKAGAYGIQGYFSRWVTRIEGDYFNVVGLPVARVYRLLRETGAM